MDAIFPLVSRLSVYRLGRFGSTIGLLIRCEPASCLPGIDNIAMDMAGFNPAGESRVSSVAGRWIRSDEVHAVSRHLHIYPGGRT